MKKLLALVMSLTLLLGMSTGALAAEGDRTVWYGASNEGFLESYLQNALLVGNQVWCITSGNELSLEVYDRDSGETATYDLEAAETLLEEENGINEEEGWVEPAVWFAWQDRVLTVINVFRNEGDEGQSLEGGKVYQLTLEGTEAKLKESDLPTLDWECMADRSGEWVNPRYVRLSFCSGNQLWTLSYDDSGNDVINSFDLTDGHSQEHYLQNLNSACAGPDGKLLVTQYNWDSDQGSVTFALFDPASEGLEVLSTRAMNGAMPQNLYYSESNNTLYFTESGELWAAANLDLENAVSVNDCPLSWEGGAVQMTADGYLMLHDNQTVILRCTDPSQRRQISLHVMDQTYLNTLDSAYYAFTARHGDVSVAIDRNGTASSILDAMMNHDDTVDIYCLDMASSEFNVLYKRGYMASMSGSERLTSVVNSFYPRLAEAVKMDDQLVALPLYGYGDTLGVNMKAFKKLGYTEADLPTTWDGFFDLLSELPAKVESTEGVRVFNTWFTVQDLRVSLFNDILTCYQNYLNTLGDQSEYAFNTPMMQHVLERLEQTDFVALGARESEEEDESGVMVSYNWEDTVLFDFNTALTMATYNSEYEPLLLAVGEEEPSGSYHVTAAFVNPYSAHINEAVAFLESAWDCVDRASVYTFSPENNEPVRYPDYENQVADVKASLQQAQDALAAATDGEEKTSWQETLTTLEEQLTEMENSYWNISPQSIASYQARAPKLVPMSYDFTSMVTGSGDSSFYEAMMRFYQGECTAMELLQQMDEKYQMMIREGN